MAQLILFFLAALASILNNVSIAQASKIIPARCLQTRKIQHYTLFTPTRFTVKTPEQYKQLENGHISHEYEIVIVEASAHPNVLLLPKQFWNAPWLGTYFVDGNNRVHLFPKSKAVWSLFATKGNVSFGIPNNYTAYEVLFAKGLEVTSKEIDYILTWTEAERLLIADQWNVAYELSHRLDELKKFKKLRLLELSIQNSTYKVVNIVEFLQHLPSLQAANFRASALTSEQFVQFVQNIRNLPRGWKLLVNDGWVALERDFFFN